MYLSDYTSIDENENDGSNSFYITRPHHAFQALIYLKTSVEVLGSRNVKRKAISQENVSNLLDYREFSGFQEF